MPKLTKSQKVTQEPVVSEAPVAKEEVGESTEKKTEKKVRKPKKTVEPSEQTVDEAQTATPAQKGKGLKRTFTVSWVTREGNTEPFDGGRYQSKTPAGAARKAANQACKTLYGKENNCSIEISIKEVTKNSSNKDYTYKATRTLDTKDVPFKGNSGKVNIPFNFSMNLKAVKKDVTGKVVAEKEVDAETETVNDASP